MSEKKQPKVFISYKHENEKQNSWVNKLTTDLIEIYGIDCHLDQFDLRAGDSIHNYMQIIKTDSTHVLFIITPAAVDSVESNTGYLPFEAQLWSALRAQKKLRVIPILREGCQTASYVEDHLYLDFRNDSNYQNKLEDLANDIQGKKYRPVPLNIQREKKESENKELLNISLISAARVGDLETVKELIEKGVNVNTINSRNKDDTALMWAATKGHRTIVRLLLDNGANVNVKSSDGGTPLIWASHYGDKIIVETLLKAGADINERSNRGTTALIVAAREGHENVVKLLLDNGAAELINAQRSDGCSALKYASKKGCFKIAKILLDNGADSKDISDHLNSIDSRSALNSIFEFLKQEKEQGK